MNEHLDPTLDNLPPEDKEFDKALRTILSDFHNLLPCQYRKK